MARSRYKFYPGDTSPYFVTATVVNWTPVFGLPGIAGIIFDSLAFLQHEKRLVIHAYVLMENHLHLVVQADDPSKELANFKSFTARRVIDYSIARGHRFYLRQFARYKLPHKTDREYQFWQEGVHPEQIHSQAMYRQKVRYIHENPVKRGYVDEPEHWRYSSARNYAGLPAVLELDLD